MVIAVTVIVITSFYSCKKWIEIDAPKSSIVPSAVFRNDDLAVSAMLGVYQQMSVSGYASGDVNSIANLGALASDEMLAYNPTLAPFAVNQIPIDNGVLRSLWSGLYSRIYNINTLIEGLGGEHTLSPAIAKQLLGEAHFARAFHYFYLVNLFGDVPLILSADYRLNRNVFRSNVNQVYRQIILDLGLAEAMLAENYPTSERVRPNRSAAQALLSRTYLHLRDWENAERYADLVISKTGMYRLTPLDEVFLKNSQEAIWQLMPTANSNTNAGNLLILTAAPTSVSIRPQFYTNGFETGDLRKANWLKGLTVQGTTYYYPFKYKVRSSATVTEYYMVFRLAEQFLIRAEARAMQNKLTLAVIDLDNIRKRAGVSEIANTNPNSSRDELVDLIHKERSRELFSEWGDRWLNLKRTGATAEVLSPLKSNWKDNYSLFPVPKIEIDNNKNITQNEGY